MLHFLRVMNSTIKYQNKYFTLMQNFLITSLKTQDHKFEGEKQKQDQDFESSRLKPRLKLSQIGFEMPRLRLASIIRISMNVEIMLMLLIEHQHYLYICAYPNFKLWSFTRLTISFHYPTESLRVT